MFTIIDNQINQLDTASILEERKEVLQKLIDFIKEKSKLNETIRLNFICTHNSRRSHLSQIWAQSMAHYFKIKNVYAYSGGTEATAMFYKVEETLHYQGFEIKKLSESHNPVYAVKFSADEHPIICFSKTYDDVFNPTNDFCAVMTCSSADDGCPFISGAKLRLPIRYNDPKAFDDTPQMAEKYLERSIEIATEMKYVFSQINN
jgi:arsenate reductase